jgi:hypothetical protein
MMQNDLLKIGQKVAKSSSKKNATPKGIAFSNLFKCAYAPNFSITAVVTPVLEKPPSWNKFCIVT